MNKIILAIIITLFVTAPTLCKAQTTNVTATITDSDGQVWSNGTFSAIFVPPPNAQAPRFCSNGNLFTFGPITGSLDSSGVLSTNLTQTTALCPSGATWQITICPNASVQCSTMSNIAVNGVTQNMTSIFSGQVKVVRFAALGQHVARGYSDSEVFPTPLPGQNYFNVTLGCNRIWGGLIWSCGSSSNGLFNNTEFDYLTSIVNGCNITTEASRFTGGNSSTSAITGCLSAPANSTTPNMTAVSGFTTSSTPGNAATYGLRGQSVCLATDTKCAGALIVTGDVAGLAATGDVEPFGAIIETFLNNPAGTYQNGNTLGLNVVGVFAFAPPSFANAVQIAGNGFPYPTAINFPDGGNTVALNIGTTSAASGASASSNIIGNARASGTTDTTASIQFVGAPPAGGCPSTVNIVINVNATTNSTVLYVCSPGNNWQAVTVP